MGLRVAPVEVETLSVWAANQPAVSRLWLTGAEHWSDSRHDAALEVTLLLAAPNGGSGLPDCDTSEWESHLGSLIAPSVSLRVLAPGTDPAPHVRGGVEIFRRAKRAAQT